MAGMQENVRYIASLVQNQIVPNNPYHHLSQGAGPSQGPPPNPGPIHHGQFQSPIAPANTSGQEAIAIVCEPSQPGSVRVRWPDFWNCNSLKELHNLQCVGYWKDHGVGIAVDWSRHKSIVAVAVGGQVVVRDVEKPKPVRYLQPEGITEKNESEFIRDLAFSEDCASIITAGLSGICHWDLHSGTLKKSMDCTGARSVSTSSKSGIFATGNDDCIVHVWKKDFKLARTLGDHAIEGCAVRALDFSRSGAKLAVGADNASLSSWDLSTGRVDVLFRGHDAAITSAKISLDERAIVSSDSSGLIRLWDVRSGRNGPTMSHGSPVSSVAYGFESRWIISGGQNGVTNLWDLRNCKPVAHIENTGAVMGVKHSIHRPSFLEIEIGGGTRLWTYYKKQSN